MCLEIKEKNEELIHKVVPCAQQVRPGPREAWLPFLPLSLL